MYILKNENLDELVKVRFKVQGVEFTQLPKDQTWLWREAHLLDPDRNKTNLV